MKHLAAYLLLQQGGNTSPTAQDIKALLSVVGIEADDAQLDNLIVQLEGKNVDELIAQGSSMLASLYAPTSGHTVDEIAEKAENAQPSLTEEDNDEDWDEGYCGFPLFD